MILFKKRAELSDRIFRAERVAREAFDLVEECVECAKEANQLARRASLGFCLLAVAVVLLLLFAAGRLR